MEEDYVKMELEEIPMSGLLYMMDIDDQAKILKIVESRLSLITKDKLYFKQIIELETDKIKKRENENKSFLFERFFDEHISDVLIRFLTVTFGNYHEELLINPDLTISELAFASDYLHNFLELIYTFQNRVKAGNLTFEEALILKKLSLLSKAIDKILDDLIFRLKEIIAVYSENEDDYIEAYKEFTFIEYKKTTIMYPELYITFDSIESGFEFFNLILEDLESLGIDEETLKKRIGDESTKKGKVIVFSKGSDNNV